MSERIVERVGAGTCKRSCIRRGRDTPSPSATFLTSPAQANNNNKTEDRSYPTPCAAARVINDAK